MKTWYAIFTMITLLKGTISFGSQILLAPPTTPTEEYEAALLSYPNSLSPIDHYLKDTPTSQSLEQLAHRFSSAEQSLINAYDLKTVSSNYKKVLELEEGDDWDEEQRRVFLICYLRLLQINGADRDSKERTLWIERSNFYLNQIEAPRDLIPPPVFREIEMKSPFVQSMEILFPEKISRKYPRVLIQGKIYDTNSAVNISRLGGPLRWTFLSHFFEPKTVIMNSSEIKKVELKSTALVSKDCENSVVRSPKFAKKPVKLYRPLHCSTSNSSLAGQVNQMSKEVSLPLSVPQPDHRWKMEKKHWVWIGVGALATAIIASQLNSQNKKAEKATPTETYGF